MIDFRYHLVSIVAVFLALAIGIVLGSTELQGTTLDALRAVNGSLTNKLNAANAQRAGYEQQANAGDAFLGTAASKLLDATLTGDRIVIVTEPGSPSSVVNGVKAAAALAGATVTGTVALQPKFNDLSGATQASLAAINAQQASATGAVLTTASASQTGYQQNAAQLIATAILNTTADQPGLTVPAAQLLLQAYAQGGYLSDSGAPWNRATLAVIVAPGSVPADGANDPANQVLLAVAQEFATLSAATLVAGSVAGTTPAGQRHLGAARQQRGRRGVQRGQRGHHPRPDLHDVGLRHPAGRREAEQLRHFGGVRGQSPGTVACAERDAFGHRHAQPNGDGRGHEDRGEEVRPRD